MLEQLKSDESKEDLAVLDTMNKINPGIFLLHNSKYTLDREKGLWSLTKQNIMNDPFYYFKSRIYHFIRLYVTGINYKKMEKSNTFAGKVNAIYPFAVTFVFIFLGLVFTSVCAVIRKINFTNIVAFILLFFYYGAIHVPFSIQARFSIPIHLLLLSILSVSILKTLKPAYD